MTEAVRVDNFLRLVHDFGALNPNDRLRAGLCRKEAQNARPTTHIEHDLALEEVRVLHDGALIRGGTRRILEHLLVYPKVCIRIEVVVSARHLQLESIVPRRRHRTGAERTTERTDAARPCGGNGRCGMESDDFSIEQLKQQAQAHRDALESAERAIESKLHALHERQAREAEAEVEKLRAEELALVDEVNRLKEQVRRVQDAVQAKRQRARALVFSESVPASQETLPADRAVDGAEDRMPSKSHDALAGLAALVRGHDSEAVRRKIRQHVSTVAMVADKSSLLLAGQRPRKDVAHLLELRLGHARRQYKARAHERHEHMRGLDRERAGLSLRLAELARRQTALLPEDEESDPADVRDRVDGGHRQTMDVLTEALDRLPEQQGRIANLREELLAERSPPQTSPDAWATIASVDSGSPLPTMEESIDRFQAWLGRDASLQDASIMGGSTHATEWRVRQLADDVLGSACSEVTRDVAREELRIREIAGESALKLLCDACRVPPGDGSEALVSELIRERQHQSPRSAEAAAQPPVSHLVPQATRRRGKWFFAPACAAEDALHAVRGSSSARVDHEGMDDGVLDPTARSMDEKAERHAALELTWWEGWDADAARAETMTPTRLPVTALAVSPRERFVALGFADGSLEVVDLGVRRRVGRWVARGTSEAARARGRRGPPAPRQAAIQRIAWSADEHTLACVGDDGTTSVWSLLPAQLLGAMAATRLRDMGGGGEGAPAAARAAAPAAEAGDGSLGSPQGNTEPEWLRAVPSLASDLQAVYRRREAASTSPQARPGKPRQPRGRKDAGAASPAGTPLSLHIAIQGAQLGAEHLAAVRTQHEGVRDAAAQPERRRRRPRRGAEVAREEGEGPPINVQPSAVCFFPCFTFTGTQPSLALGLHCGVVAKVNLPGSDGAAIGATLGPAPPLITAGVPAGPAYPPMVDSARVSVEHLCGGHKARVVLCEPISIAETAGLGLLTLDEEATIAIWEYASECRSSFGWFRPRGPPERLPLLDRVLLADDEEDQLFPPPDLRVPAKDPERHRKFTAASRDHDQRLTASLRGQLLWATSTSPRGETESVYRLYAGDGDEEEAACTVTKVLRTTTGLLLQHTSRRYRVEMVEGRIASAAVTRGAGELAMLVLFRHEGGLEAHAQIVVARVWPKPLPVVRIRVQLSSTSSAPPSMAVSAPSVSTGSDYAYVVHAGVLRVFSLCSGALVKGPIDVGAVHGVPFDRVAVTSDQRRILLACGESLGTPAAPPCVLLEAGFQQALGEGTDDLEELKRSLRYSAWRTSLRLGSTRQGNSWIMPSGTSFCNTSREIRGLVTAVVDRAMAEVRPAGLKIAQSGVGSRATFALPRGMAPTPAPASDV